MGVVIKVRCALRTKIGVKISEKNCLRKCAAVCSQHQQPVFPHFCTFLQWTLMV